MEKYSEDIDNQLELIVSNRLRPLDRSLGDFSS